MLRLSPSLDFEHAARKALTHYQTALGGELQLISYAEYKSGDPSVEITDADREGVVYGVLRTDAGLRIQASDVGEPVISSANLAIELSGQPEDLDYLRAAFDILADGGTVKVPFVEAEWGGGDWWGLLTDKFGVDWSFMVWPEGKYL